MKKKSEHAGVRHAFPFTVKSGEKSKQKYLLTIPTKTTTFGARSASYRLNNQIQIKKIERNKT